MGIEHVTPDCLCEGKRCTKCKQLRCIGQYNKDKRLKSGLQSACKVCLHRDNKEWREENPEYNRGRIRAYHSLHPADEKEYWAQYKLRIDRREYHRSYRIQNIEKVRAKDRLFGHSPQKRAYSKRRYQQTREQQIANSTRWRKNNLARCAAREARRRTLKTLAGGSYTVAEWEDLKAKYTYSCLCCRKQEPEIKLTADHIIPVTKGGSSNIDNIQPLCGTCNTRKRTRIIDYRDSIHGKGHMEVI